MDAITLVAVFSGLTGLVASILTHLKHSDCCKGMCEIDTREPIVAEQPQPQPIAPSKTHRLTLESEV